MGAQETLTYLCRNVDWLYLVFCCQPQLLRVFEYAGPIYRRCCLIQIHTDFCLLKKMKDRFSWYMLSWNDTLMHPKIKSFQHIVLSIWNKNSKVYVLSTCDHICLTTKLSFVYLQSCKNFYFYSQKPFSFVPLICTLNTIHSFIII